MIIHLPAWVGPLILGFWLLLLQPGAIPLGYVTARRHRRSGGTNPKVAGFVGWLLGCVLVAVGALALGGAGLDPVSVLVLSYLPPWLLVGLLWRRQV